MRLTPDCRKKTVDVGFQFQDPLPLQNRKCAGYNSFLGMKFTQKTNPNSSAKRSAWLSVQELVASQRPAVEKDTELLEACHANTANRTRHL